MTVSITQAHAQEGGTIVESACAPDSMVWISGGSFLMGSESFYMEERPVHRECVDGFWIDRYPVTNSDFSKFVAATSYVTLAERNPARELYPDAAAELLVPGSAVFIKPSAPTSLRDHRAWWAYVPGADWRHPYGPESSIDGLENHPVVHVAFEDACAYSQWANKELPTEIEWEFAARGGLDGATYPWGDEPSPGGQIMANIWHGRFPFENSMADGYERTSPVGSFPPNGYGLYDVVGNVWEWTTTTFKTSAMRVQSCCQSDLLGDASVKRVVKGGSHLCAPNYCIRYRPAARQGEATDTSTSHIGFRCVSHK